MKHLNKIASVFCVAAMALTALTGCEGSDMFSVNSPDWISEKIDSINAAKGNDNALPEGEEDVYTIGATDYSTGWWTAFSKYYVVPEGKTWNAVFNLNINPSAPNTYKTSPSSLQVMMIVVALTIRSMELSVSIISLAVTLSGVIILIEMV